MRSDRSLPKQPPGLLCLVCGVDSGPVLSFFVWLIGGTVLAFMAFGIWGYLTGKFRSSDSVAEIPLQIETLEEEERRLHGN